MFEEKDFSNHQEELEEVYGTIRAMNVRGAKTSYFKNEGPAFYLPNIGESLKNQNDNDFGVRLYCAIPLNNVVVLLNGGIKTKWKPEDCPNVKKHFTQAIKIALKLNKELMNGNLSDESDLTGLTIDI